MIYRLDIYSDINENTEVAFFDLGQDAPEYQFWIGEAAGLFLLYSPGGGAAVATHSEFFGKYTSEPGYENLEYTVSAGCKPSGKLGVADRRVSTRMSYETERILNSISLSLGATWGGSGTWRKLLNHIASGRITCVLTSQLGEALGGLIGALTTGLTGYIVQPLTGTANEGGSVYDDPKVQKFLEQFKEDRENKGFNSLADQLAERPVTAPTPQVELFEDVSGFDPGITPFDFDPKEPDFGGLDELAQMQTQMELDNLAKAHQEPLYVIDPIESDFSGLDANDMLQTQKIMDNFEAQNKPPLYEIEIKKPEFPGLDQLAKWINVN